MAFPMKLQAQIVQYSRAFCNEIIFRYEARFYNVFVQIGFIYMEDTLHFEYLSSQRSDLKESLRSIL